VLGHELQVGPAPRADLVHGVDFRLHRMDQRFALGDALDLQVDVSRMLLHLAESLFEVDDLFFHERKLRPPLFELLHHRLGALQMVFGGFGLAHRVALASLYARQLGDELVFYRTRARELVAGTLHLLLALGDVSGHRPALLHELDEPRAFFAHHGFVADNRPHLLIGCLHLLAESVHFARERRQLVLEGGDAIEPLLRVDDLGAERVAEAHERLDLRAP
jgi:hypothetical protein